MQVVVMGAGAVGCYYGARLASAGHAVTLIGRASHMDAVQRDGLRFETAQHSVQLPMATATTPDAARDAELLLFCVKSTDTEATGAALRPHLPQAARVLSLQNGVDNAERLAAVLSRPVAPVAVYVAAEMAGPGHVRHNGRGELVIGRSADADALARLFGAAGVPVQISDNVRGELWAKLVLNCAYNALSAIVRLPYGPLMQGDGARALVDEVVAECLAVAAADGVTVPDTVTEAVRRIPLTMAAQFSSTAQDLARGRRSEIEHLNGHVVRRGAALGVPTPVNGTLRTIVRLIEDRPAT